MPVIVTCEDCGKQFRLGDEFAGRTLPCKACGTEFRVPGAPRAAAARRNEPPRPRRRRDDDFDEDDEGGSSTVVWIVGGAAAVVVLIGVVVAILVISGKKDDPDRKEDRQLAQNNTVDENPVNGNPAVGNRVDDNPPRNDNRAGRDVEPPRRVPPPPINRPVIPRRPERRRQQPIPRNRAPGGLIPAKNTAAGGGADDTRKVTWNVTVDPPEKPVEFNAKKPLRIPLTDRSGYEHVVFSENNAFAIVGTNNIVGKSSEIWDLQRARKTGGVGGIPFLPTQACLSPDGLHVAVMNRNANGVWLWDVKRARSIATLPAAVLERRAQPQILKFAGSKRLVTAGPLAPMKVWSIPEGKVERTIEIPRSYDRNAVAVSPGGRYLALHSLIGSQSTLHVYDLNTGKTAGTILLPKSTLGRSWNCQGLVFSEDGMELAGLFEGFFNHSRIYCWNVADGKVAVQHDFAATASGKRPNVKTLQWFTDKSRWLVYGQHVVDRKVGGPIWKTRSMVGRDHDSPFRLLGGTRIAVVSKLRRGLGLHTFHLPLDAIAQAAQVHASGGSNSDVGLPQLTQPADSSGKRIPIGFAADSWKASADPAPTPKGKLLAKPLSLKAGAGHISGVQLSRADAGLCLVSSNVKTGRSTDSGFIWPKPVAFRFDRYNLVTGKHIDSLAVKREAAPLAFSPSGKRLATRYWLNTTRIDVWTLDGAKHIVGWKPFKREKNRIDVISGAFFVDDEHILIWSAGGKQVVLWKLPECRAVYSIISDKYLGPPVLSPGGQFLAVPYKEHYGLFRALTGEPVGRLRINGTPKTAAFHPDGKRLAVTYETISKRSSFSHETKTGYELGIWDMSNGRKISTIPIPTSPRTTRWCGENSMLFRTTPLEDALLFDVKNQSVIWRYKIPEGGDAPTSPDERFWHLAGTTRSADLRALRLPDSDTQKRLTGKDLSPKLILKPGTKVSLDIQLSGLAAQKGLKDELVKSWTKKLEANGVIVAAGEPLVLYARADMTGTGESAEFVISKSRLAFTGRTGLNTKVVGRETISQTRIKCRIVFGINNKSYGGQKSTVHNFLKSPLFPLSYQLENNESASARLRRMQLSIAARFFRDYEPPRHLFGPDAAKGHGHSTLTVSGARYEGD